MIKTFTLAWLQVTLICLNTWQIANTHYIGALIVGFLISLIWTMNVGRVALSSWQTKLIYSFGDRKSTRLNSSHGYISYAVFCLKKKTTNKKTKKQTQTRCKYRKFLPSGATSHTSNPEAASDNTLCTFIL